jgi:hypothetical protein
MRRHNNPSDYNFPAQLTLENKLPNLDNPDLSTLSRQRYKHNDSARNYRNFLHLSSRQENKHKAEFRLHTPHPTLRKASLQNRSSYHNIIFACTFAHHNLCPLTPVSQSHNHCQEYKQACFRKEADNWNN